MKILEPTDSLWYLGNTMHMQTYFRIDFKEKKVIQWHARISIYSLLMHLLRSGWSRAGSAVLGSELWVRLAKMYCSHGRRKNCKRENQTVWAHVKTLLVWCLLSILAKASHRAEPKVKQWRNAFLPWRLGLGREWEFERWSDLPQVLNLMNRETACEAHTFLE